MIYTSAFEFIGASVTPLMLDLKGYITEYTPSRMPALLINRQLKL
jgi:hypothetical protein